MSKSLKLSLQDGSNAITIGHDIAYRREQGLTTRYHSLTAPNGRGELSLFPTERVVFPNDPKAATTDEQPRYDANTENTLARERVAELPDGQIKSDIIKDLDSGQPLTAERAARLNASAYRATHAFKILDNLDKMAHPSSVSGEFHKETESTRQKTEAALRASYGSDVNAYETARADAEQSQASLQARIATHYAGVVQKQIDQKDALETDIRVAQAKEGGESGKALRAETNRRLGVEVAPDGKLIKTAAEKDRAELAELRGELERGDNNQASAKIFALYEKNQRDIQEQSVMAMRAQAHRYKKYLNSVFDKYLLPGKSRTPYAKSYEKEFNGYLKDFDAAKAERSQAEKQFAEAKTPEEREAAQNAYSVANKKWNDTYSAFLKTVTSPRFERDISKIQNRIGKVEFARTTSIVIASSVVGGVVGMGARLAIGAAAGRVVGAVNATRIAGTGAFLAETTAFTATERALSNSPDGTFTKDLLTNFAMFGAMKGAGKWYEQSFKTAKETSPLLYRTGQIGSEITTAHVANEAAFRVENGRFMNRDERVQSLASAGVMVPGLHAGALAAKKTVTETQAARSYIAKETDHAIRKAAGRALTLRFGEARPKLAEGADSASTAPTAPLKESNLIYLGSGEVKNGYAYGENQVVTKVKPGGDPAIIHKELDLLKLIRDQGYPTVDAKLVTVDGEPAILMERYAQDSKKVVDRNGRNPYIKGDSPYLNKQSIADLERIMELNNRGPVILDLQFLIAKDGRVVVADPKDIMSNSNPFLGTVRKYNNNAIKLLIQVAQRHR